MSFKRVKNVPYTIINMLQQQQQQQQQRNVPFIVDGTSFELKGQRV